MMYSENIGCSLKKVIYTVIIENHRLNINYILGKNMSAAIQLIFILRHKPTHPRNPLLLAA